MPIATGRRVKPGFHTSFSRFDFAGDIFADSTFCPEGD
jgi:hypothetical protein